MKNTEESANTERRSSPESRVLVCKRLLELTNSKSQDASFFHICTNPKYEIIPLQKQCNVTQAKRKSNKSILGIRGNDTVTLKCYTESFRNLKYHLGYQIFELETYCKFSSVHKNSRCKSGFSYIGTMQYKPLHQWITFYH